MSKSVSLSTGVSRAIFWNTALFPIKTALSFASSIILVRALAKEEFAAFTAVTAVLTTVGTYSDLGIERTLSKFFPEISRRFGRPGTVEFLRVILICKLAVLALLILILNVFADWFSSYFHFGADGRSFIATMSVLLVLGMFSDVFLQLLYSYFKQRATNSLNIVFATLQPLLIITFIILGLGVPGVLLALVLSTALSVAFIVPSIYRTLRELAPVPAEPPTAGAWRNLWGRFARLAALNYFFNITVYFYDMPFVVAVLSSTGNVLGVAAFGLAYNRVVNPILQFLFAPMTGIQQPLFAHLYVEQDTRKLQEAYAVFTRFLCLILVPAGVGLALLADNLIRIFFQSRYEEASILAIWLVVFLFTETLIAPSHNILLAHEHLRAVIITRIIALASIPLMFWLTPTYGALGAVVAAGLGRVASRFSATVYAWRVFSLRFPAAFLGRVAAATAIMAGAMLIPLEFLQRPSTVTETIVQTALAFVTGSLVFGLAFKLLGGLEPADKQRLVTLKVPLPAFLLRWL